MVFLVAPGKGIRDKYVSTIFLEVEFPHVFLNMTENKNTA